MELSGVSVGEGPQPKAAGNGSQERGELTMDSLLKKLRQAATFRAHGVGFMIGGFTGRNSSSAGDSADFRGARFKESEHSQRGQLQISI